MLLPGVESTSSEAFVNNKERKQQYQVLGFMNSFYYFLPGVFVFYFLLFYLVPQIMLIKEQSSRYSSENFGFYFFCFYSCFMVYLFMMIVFGYIKENNGNRRNIYGFVERLQLNKFKSWMDLVWMFGTVVVSGLFFYILTPFLSNLLESYYYFDKPYFIPDELVFGRGVFKDGYFLDYYVKGNYLFLFSFFIITIFSSFTEELMFRGFLLSKMEVKFKKYTFIIIAALYGIMYSYCKWNILTMFVVSIPISWIAQYRKNIWIPIFVHFFFKGIILLLVFKSVTTEKQMAVIGG